MDYSLLKYLCCRCAHSYWFQSMLLWCGWGEKVGKQGVSCSDTIPLLSQETEVVESQANGGKSVCGVWQETKAEELYSSYVRSIRRLSDCPLKGEGQRNSTQLKFMLIMSLKGKLHLHPRFHLHFYADVYICICNTYINSSGVSSLSSAKICHWMSGSGAVLVFIRSICTLFCRIAPKSGPLQFLPHCSNSKNSLSLSAIISSFLSSIFISWIAIDIVGNSWFFLPETFEEVFKASFHPSISLLLKLFFALPVTVSNLICWNLSLLL